jgi:ABC-2 type transport system permease protein
MITRPFFALVRKDLKLHMGNRRALLFTLAVPVAIASFFGFVMGGQSGKTKAGAVSIQVADLDQSALSEEIITHLSQDDALKVSRVSEDAARAAIRQGKVAAAVIFPANFGAHAVRGFFGRRAKPELTILHDPSRAMEAGMVQGILLQRIMETIGKNVFSGEIGRKNVQETLASIDNNSNLSPEDSRRLRNLLTDLDVWMGYTSTNSNAPTLASEGFAMPFTVKDEETAESPSVASGYNGYAHAFGGMSMQFVLMAAIEWGLAILVERQRGLWRRLRAAPLSRGTLLAGRAASSSLIALGTLAVCWGFSMVVFHVQVLGSWPGFIACNVALALFAASFGLLIAAAGKTPEATRGIAIFFVLILVMLGGAWVPSFVFPGWVQQVTWIIPTRWAMEGLDAMTWRGLGWHSALAPVSVLLGSAVACALLTHRLFRWETD